jgi:hypothetical protein
MWLVKNQVKSTTPCVIGTFGSGSLMGIPLTTFLHPNDSKLFMIYFLLSKMYLLEQSLCLHVQCNCFLPISALEKVSGIPVKDNKILLIAISFKGFNL